MVYGQKIRGAAPTQYSKGSSKEFSLKVFVCFDRAEATQKNAMLFDYASI